MIYASLGLNELTVDIWEITWNNGNLVYWCKLTCFTELWIWFEYYKLMTLHNTAVTSLLTLWSYYSFALSHGNNIEAVSITLLAPQAHNSLLCFIEEDHYPLILGQGRTTSCCTTQFMLPFLKWKLPKLNMKPGVSGKKFGKFQVVVGNMVAPR